jgi:hypothetical protein
MLHILAFIYFVGTLGAAFAIIAATLHTDRDRIAAVLGLRSKSALPPLPLAARRVVTVRVIRTASPAPALRLAA